MILKRLGFYQKPKKKTRHNLKNYFVDSYGNVWTMNNHTYVTKYGRRLVSSKGVDVTVTLRDEDGVKVSINRNTLIRAYCNNSTANF